MLTISDLLLAMLFAGFIWYPLGWCFHDYVNKWNWRQGNTPGSPFKKDIDL